MVPEPEKPPAEPVTGFACATAGKMDAKSTAITERNLRMLEVPNAQLRAELLDVLK